MFCICGAGSVIHSKSPQRNDIAEAIFNIVLHHISFGSLGDLLVALFLATNLKSAVANGEIRIGWECYLVSVGNIHEAFPYHIIFCKDSTCFANLHQKNAESAESCTENVQILAKNARLWCKID